MRRAFEYQLIEEQSIQLGPDSFWGLRCYEADDRVKTILLPLTGGVRELHNSDIIARERPALAMSISQRLSPEDRIRMEEAKAGILAVARASGMTQ